MHGMEKKEIFRSKLMLDANGMEWYEMELNGVDWNGMI